MGLRFQSYNSDEQAGGDIAEATEQECLNVVSIRNARWDHVATFPGCKGVHIIRDPRDVLISGYFSHLKTHPVLSSEMAAERALLQSLNKEEGLIKSMDGINGRTLDEMGEWNYDENSDIVEMRLETMSGQPQESLRRILAHGKWISEEPREGDDPLVLRFMGLVNQAWRRSRGVSLFHCRLSRMSEGAFNRLDRWVGFERLSGGRKPGQINENSHYRKGVSGDWVNNFTPEVKAAFKKRFGDLVSRLGYEQDESW